MTKIMIVTCRPSFELGQIVATPGALQTTTYPARLHTGVCDTLSGPQASLGYDCLRDGSMTIQKFKPMWVTGRDEATLIDLATGRVHAHVARLRKGLYCPTVVVSPWRALYLLRRCGACVVSLRAFPRCTVKAVGLCANTLGLATQQAEFALGYYGPAVGDSDRTEPAQDAGRCHLG
jgi:hypothetical protein